MTPRKKSPAAAGPAKTPGYCALPERMPAIPLEKLTDAQKKAVAAISATPRGGIRGPFWPMLRSPEFMNRAQTVGEYLRFLCPLDKRIGELAALMGARAWTQQYEWNAHYPQAIAAGLKRSIADAIGECRRPVGMAEDEEIVYEFISELLANKSVSDPTYARAAAKFGEKGIIDLIGIVGYYSLLAMIMNVARTAIPDGKPLPLAPMPDQIRSGM